MSLSTPTAHSGLDCCSSHRLQLTSRMTQAMFAPMPQALVRPLGKPRIPSQRIPRTRADLVVLGKVATGDPANPLVDAMAVRDGRVVALGSVSDMEGLTGAGTEIVETGRGVITPGFIEPHMHLWVSVLVDSWLNCSQLQNPTFDDVVARLKNAVENTADGEWVHGQLFDPVLFPGEPNLTVDVLDGISTTTPIVVLNASMHYAYVNSKVYELAGITKDTPDPAGGRYEKSASGELNGVLAESGAILSIMSAMPQRSQSELLGEIRNILNRAASVGVTSVRDALTGTVMGPGEISVLHQLNAVDRLPTRVTSAVHSALGMQAWSNAGVTPMSGDDMVRTVAWKVIADGSNQGRSGYMRDAYLGQPDNHGHANMTEEQLVAVIKEGHDAGWQVMCHANGDGAMDMVVAAYEAALAGAGAHDLRHRIEHCSIAYPEHFERMAKIGVQPSFLMNHVYYWGAVLRDRILGSERTDQLDAVADALAAGLRPSLHSDYSVSPIQPLRSAQTAVERKTRADGEVLNPAQRVSAEAALRAITADAAWQVHADELGTLKVGAPADYALLSDNPWTTDPSEWENITVHETRIDGTPAWTS